MRLDQENKKKIRAWAPQSLGSFFLFGQSVNGQGTRLAKKEKKKRFASKDWLPESLIFFFLLSGPWLIFCLFMNGPDKEKKIKRILGGKRNKGVAKGDHRSIVKRSAFGCLLATYPLLSLTLEGDLRRTECGNEVPWPRQPQVSPSKRNLFQLLELHSMWHRSTVSIEWDPKLEECEWRVAHEWTFIHSHSLFSFLFFCLWAMSYFMNRPTTGKRDREKTLARRHSFIFLFKDQQAPVPSCWSLIEN